MSEKITIGATQNQQLKMWNYRIIQASDKSYGLHEVIYNDDGEISFVTENPEIIGCSVKDLLNTLRLMLDDAQKASNNILEMDKIEFSPICEDYDKEDTIPYEEFDKTINVWKPSWDWEEEDKSK